MIAQIIRGSTGHWETESDRRHARRVEICFLDEALAHDLALGDVVQMIADQAEAGNTGYFAQLLEAPEGMDDAVAQLIAQIVSSEIAETYRDHISERSDSACHLDYHWLERGCHFQVDLSRSGYHWFVERIWFCR
ncbi:hypothetical protein JXA47_01940 [Candidatus Sumerlaeota bacterium]|nr:hypothetical protein [Candidatus Sumerlaeota bacterium]